MTIKDKMYYRKTSSARNYSNTPSGTMYVERLIASKPCFSSAIQQGEQEKKSLVLADWTSPTWSKDKCKQVQKTLSDLIDDGFALYSWQNGRVIPINKNHLLTMSFLDGMTPASEQEVTNAAIIQKENKLTKEQVMVIDNYCLNSLINNTETKEPRTIRTSEIPSDWSDQTLEKMITLLTTSKPKLEEIILDEFSYEKSRINCILKDKFKNVKFKEDYQVFDNFRINDEKAQIIADNLTLNINSLRDIEEISIQKYYTDNIDFTLSKIGSVKTLIIGSHQFQSLISLQALFPKIQTLDLSDCDNITGCFEGKSLTNLVKINLGCTDISKADVEDLLKNAPNLQELNLSDCEDITGCFEGKSLTNLVKINLGGSKISKADVEDLLKNAPNLQELDLSYCKEITGCFERKSLTNLVKINLCRSKISKADVEDLLKNAPNLQELDLRECRNITGCFKEKNLNNLVKIDLGNSGISKADVEDLLKNAPNLQELDLSCCNDITGCFKKKNLNNLVKIDLGGSKISKADVEDLLKNVPNLQELSLRGCPNITGCFEEVNLNSLMIIDLGSISISQTDLVSLLQHSPNLKAINFCNISNMSNFLENVHDLKNLVEISFMYDTQISINDLIKLKKIAPNLNQKSIDLINSFFQRTNSTSPPTTTSIPQPKPVDSIHDPKLMKEFKPTPQDAPFQYKDLKTKHQGMVINKLCQYLITEQIHTHVIPKIQDGMCCAMSYYFSNMDRSQWDKFIKLAQEWDVKSEIDDSLKEYFDQLVTYVKKYQLQPQPSSQYIGDNLQLFLDNTTTPVVLTDPWHAICIKPIAADNNTWQVYDPNYVDGYKTISKKELHAEITKSLGTLISINSDNQPDCKSSILNPNKFIENGGLLALCSCENVNDMLKDIPENYVWTKKALDGIRCRSTSGTPAWFLGGKSKNPKINKLTTTLLSAFKNQDKNYATTLSQSLAALTSAQKNECSAKLREITAKQQSTAGTTASPFDPSELIEEIRSQANKKNYETRLQTWKKTAEKAESHLAYCMHCLKNDKGASKRLIELDSTKHVNGIRIHLEQTAKNLNRKIFYIDKPDDLVRHILCHPLLSMMLSIQDHLVCQCRRSYD